MCRDGQRQEAYANGKIRGMATLKSRLGGICRGGEVEAVIARCDEMSADGSTRKLTETLKEVADEASHVILWILEAGTLLAIAMALALLFKAHEWRHFLALATTIAFLTTTASMGGYLISIKTGTEGGQS